MILRGDGRERVVGDIKIMMKINTGDVMNDDTEMREGNLRGMSGVLRGDKW